MSNRQRLLADNDENCSKVSSKSIHVLIPYLFFAMKKELMLRYQFHTLDL